MFSFKSLALLSAFALGAATTAYAAPLEGMNVLARCGCNSVATIIDDVTVLSTPIVQEFHYITAQNCTVEALTPLVDNLKTVISGAIAEVNALAGQPTEIILATIDGTAQISVGDLAQLIATLVILIFSALGAVLNVAGASVIALIIPLLAIVGEVLGSLIVAILGVTGGLLGGLAVAIFGYIGEVIAVIVRLNVTTFIYTFSIQV